MWCVTKCYKTFLYLDIPSHLMPLEGVLHIGTHSAPGLTSVFNKQNFKIQADITPPSECHFEKTIAVIHFLRLAQNVWNAPITWITNQNTVYLSVLTFNFNFCLSFVKVLSHSIHCDKVDYINVPSNITSKLPNLIVYNLPFG